MHLRLAQSVAAVFYLPHMIAQEIGAFRDEGLTVEIITAFGQQWALLHGGAADIALGGRTLDKALDTNDGTRNVVFCAALRANTWFVIGRHAGTPFHWADLAGRTVIGLPDYPQAICLRWVLMRHGVDPQQMTLRSGRDTAIEIQAFRAGEGDYLLHSLHTAAPLVAAGEAVLLQELATPTGFVPWSTYAARPDVLRSRRPEFEAFTRAIGRALRWIDSAPPAAAAALLLRYFPDWSLASLADVVATYQPLGVWPRDPLVPRADWDHYNTIYQATGTPSLSVRYDDYVDAGLAEKAMAGL